MTVVEEHPLSEKSRILCTGRQFHRHIDVLAIEMQHSVSIQAGNVHSTGVATNIVQMELVDNQGAAGFPGVEGQRFEAMVLGLDLHRPIELFIIQIEGQDAVVAGRSQVQFALVDKDTVAVDQERV
jgi:hypothetical protein